ncbi:MAG: uracil-DNA glycosylase [Aliishimia sp.]
MFDLSRLGAWKDLPFFADDLPQIAAVLRSETREVYPPASKVFAALEACQPDDVKVVILGQDPYHTQGKADGLAFSIPQGFGGRLDSLGNILKEIETDLGVPRTQTDLSDWAEQGVLLLNTALTVPQGAAKAHAKIGWSNLVNQVLALLDTKPRAFVLWGGPAHSFGARLQNPDHLRIETAHPSPLSAYRGFFGARPFSTVNQWLMDQNKPQITWTDPT